MQTIWSRSLRPQSTCRCFSCTKSLPSTLSRRSTTGIHAKRLTTGDAFTLLLGPVLGGALIIDTSAKAKRRKEWDEKIAAVQAEVDQIQANLSSAHNLGGRSLRRLPGLTRRYSSLATARATAEEDLHSIEDVEEIAPADFDLDDQHVPRAPGVDLPDNDSHQEFANMVVESKVDDSAFPNCKRLQRLVAIKLAIRMMLHLHIGKSPRYIHSKEDYDDQAGRLPHNVDDLVRHLKQVRNSLRSMGLNKLELRATWEAYQNLTRGQRSAIDREMAHLAWQFRRGELNVTQLVEEFARRLLRSSDSPSVRGYIPFLSVLSRARFDELGFMIDGTMIEARLPYDEHTIFALVWQYGKNKEAHYLDKLLKKLTTSGAAARFGEKWLWKNIDEVIVPIPPSEDPQLLQILVYAALKCSQPHRAEAWSKVLMWNGNGNRWLSHIMSNFLKYYAANKDWQKGYVWLRTVLDKAESLAEQGIRHLQRVVFAMLEFCVVGGKRDAYQQVLDAAAECRLGVYSADPDLSLTKRSENVLKEWETCHKKNFGPAVNLSSVEKARLFAQKLHRLHCVEFPANMDQPSFADRLFKDDTHNCSTSDLGPEPNRWRELCVQQQAQLDVLKKQVESLRFCTLASDIATQTDCDETPAVSIKKIPFRAPRSILGSFIRPTLAFEARQAGSRAFASKASPSSSVPRPSNDDTISSSDESFDSPFMQKLPQRRALQRNSTPSTAFPPPEVQKQRNQRQRPAAAREGQEAGCEFPMSQTIQSNSGAASRDEEASSLRNRGRLSEPEQSGLPATRRHGSARGKSVRAWKPDATKPAAVPPENSRTPPSEETTLPITYEHTPRKFLVRPVQTSPIVEVEETPYARARRNFDEADVKNLRRLVPPPPPQREKKVDKAMRRALQEWLESSEGEGKV
jgi:hypothetical protein